ncbi:hypothetical protein WJX81_007821 [Elliptochloris bilobata]|uniref:Translocator protein n=1 Tax=Elliptochloris bilobata TaxID=381761 RepID=A0AAW1S640_9CHLO
MGNYLSAPLVIAIAIPEVLGALVSASTAKNITWYQTLSKPSWAPPTWAFGQLWSFLYACIGAAAFVVWTEGGFSAQQGSLTLLGINMVLNLAWMPIFFNAKNMTLSIIDNIAALLTAVLVCTKFYQINKLSGYLLYPYVAFLVFANALNISIATKNKNLDDGIYKDFTKDQAFKNPGEAGYRPKPPPATASAAPLPSLTRAPRSRPARLLVGVPRRTLAPMRASARMMHAPGARAAFAL